MTATTVDRVRDWVLPAGVRFSLGEALTIGFAYFTVGLTVAVLHVSEGTHVLVMIGVIFLLNSVTPGLAYVAVTDAGGSTVAGVLSGWLVSTRFGLFAASIAPHLWPERWKRAIAAHTSFDPNVALSLREDDDVDIRRVYVATSFWLCAPWVVGGTLGALIGTSIGDPATLGLDAIFPSVLLVIVWPQLRERQPLVIALAASIVALLLVETTPGGVPVLASACAAMLALVVPGADPATSATAGHDITDDGSAG